MVDGGAETNAADRRICVVIPVHNRRHITIAGLRSLMECDTTGLSVHVVVVDDGSTDGTGAAVRAAFPAVELVDGDGSLHYAGGTNRGIEAALAVPEDREPEFIITANDDAEFDPMLFQRLIASADRNPGAVVGALLVRHGDRSVAFQVGLHFDVWYGGWHVPQRWQVDDLPAGDLVVETLVGNCLMVPTQLIREVGLMDDRRFPVGAADVQWIRRMQNAGRRCVVATDALVFCLPNDSLPSLRSIGVRETLQILLIDRQAPPQSSSPVAGGLVFRSVTRRSRRRLLDAMRATGATLAGHRALAELARPRGTRPMTWTAGVAAGIAAAVLTLVLTWPFARALTSIGLVDRPNHRSMHTGEIPRGGGAGLIVAITAVTLACVVAGLDDRVIVILGLSLGLAGVGFLDDRHNLAFTPRLLAQLAVSLAAIAIVREPELSTVSHWPMTVTVLATIVWFLGCCNAVNFMDGVNGITGLHALVFGLHLVVIGHHDELVRVPALMACGASLGFLYWNAVRRKVFLGDGGAYFVGTYFALLVIRRSATRPGR